MRDFFFWFSFFLDSFSDAVVVVVVTNIDFRIYLWLIPIRGHQQRHILMLALFFEHIYNVPLLTMTCQCMSTSTVCMCVCHYFSWLAKAASKRNVQHIKIVFAQSMYKHCSKAFDMSNNPITSSISFLLWYYFFYHFVWFGKIIHKILET